MGRLERDAERICARFRLRYRALEPERSNVRSRYGVCFSDGTIRIRLSHATTGRPLKYSSLVNTLCHELAHLRHFHHGPSFQHFYGQILEWARGEGIYRPRAPFPPPRPPPRPPPSEACGPRTSAQRTPAFGPSSAIRPRRGRPAETGQLELFG